MSPEITIDDTSSNTQSNFDEVEIIKVKKKKHNIFKKFFNIFRKNKNKKNNITETENEISNYNTITSNVSFTLPSSLTLMNNKNSTTCCSTSTSQLCKSCKSSTTTVKFIPSQNQKLLMPSILNRSLFVSPLDDTISEADTEITLVDSFDTLEKKKNQSKKKKRSKGKDIKSRHKRRHSWQDDSFNEHMEDPRNCRTVTNIKDILNDSQQVELHREITSSSFEVVLDQELATEIKKEIPKFYRDTCNHWYLEYSLGEHGASITTFYENQMYCDSPVVIVITDSYGSTFGAYLNESFNPNNSGFYGNRECFLWKKASTGIRVFRASALNEYFMLSDPDFIAMGVDGNGVFGLFLDNMLLYGESSPCDTYLNEILSSKKRFECASLEVWSLQYE